jgi:natural product biosynthesis luciferase-like monooxygenase protein
MVRAVIIGDESLLVQCAERLLRNDVEIVAVITDSAAIADWARSASLPVLSASADFASDLEGTAFDWLLSITNLRVLPPALLRLPRRGAINFHDGPLPRYGGLNAAAWAIVDGVSEHGVSWHRMTEAVDAGAVLAQRMFAVGPDETALSINAKCWEAAIQSFEVLLPTLKDAAELPAGAAPLDHATFHRRADRPTGQGLLDVRRPAEALHRLVRVSQTGTYPNPFSCALLALGDGLYIAEEATVVANGAGAQPGAVLGVDEGTLTVATSDGALRLAALYSADGVPVASAMGLGLSVGNAVPAPDPRLAVRLDEVARPLIRHEAEWVRRLSTMQPLVVAAGGGSLPNGEPSTFEARLDPAGAVGLEELGSLAGLYLLRLSGRTDGDIGLSTAGLATRIDGASALFASVVPLHVAADPSEVTSVAASRTTESLRAIDALGTFARTVWRRSPVLRRAHPQGAPAWPVRVEIGCAAPLGASQLVVSLHDDRRVQWQGAPAAFTPADLERLHRGFEAFVADVLAHPSAPLRDAAIMDEASWTQLTVAQNRTSIALNGPPTVHEQIAAQALRSPRRTAVVCNGASMTYAELDARAEALAHELVHRGVTRDVAVALVCERSLDLVVAMYAVLKAGGAYVPVDPHYPADRVALMLEDSGARVIITQRALQGRFTTDHSRECLVDDPASWAITSAERLPTRSGGADLAYIIYTSGSTGRPKGVMVEHRNVINFFAGMDTRLGTTPGTWLAVTSLSFDISVLELCWTLARGYTVVLFAQETPVMRPTSSRRSARPISFSLFYFSADSNELARDKYRLLLEGARFADTHGFEAVWTPERHFHAFGGLYPNPSVTGAAVAAITSRVGIRAGSCVLPLHHPLRVAEEWSVVDNISNGRVGVSFAAGWQPNDFVLRPDAFADAKGTMFREITTVQRLWRGEALPFAGPKGEVSVRMLPRPVQSELPFWITTAGNPETFEQAGTFGGNILTHLLGQTVDELAGKLQRYREAWRAAGHPGTGRVTLMVHTFIGDDEQAVKAHVRGPMIEYLRTSVGLIKQHLGAFPTLRRREGSDGSDIDFASLTPEENEALLEYSFERYYESSALFGTPESARAMVDRIREIGVDEIACLVDFGLETQTVLDHLAPLDVLRAATSVPAAVDAEEADYSIAALIERHAVTHLQCTPSLARLLLMHEETRESLRRLRTMCVGGEAFPPALADELVGLVGGDVLNMYGPTETTIWSTTHRVTNGPGSVPLGTPIANTSLFVVDAFLVPVPFGVPGELLIGGAGVARGYLDRPELTAERFVTLVLRDGRQVRAYRTGDLVRALPDGRYEFLGRIDTQVKIRGYRIELGEIEALIAGDPAVSEVAVVAREDVEGDPRLIAYLTARPATTIDEGRIRQALGKALPDFMTPSQFIVLPDLPRTPNKKIDRKALPAPETVRPAAATLTPPTSGMEQAVAAVWQEVLRLPTVGTRDNFFDLGGHSMLAVQVHGRLTKAIGRDFPITDLFRFPTIAALAAHLAPSTDATPAEGSAPEDRALARRSAMQRRLVRNVQ